MKKNTFCLVIALVKLTDWGKRSFQHISLEAAPVFMFPQDAGDERPTLIEVSQPRPLMCY